MIQNTDMLEELDLLRKEMDKRTTDLMICVYGPERSGKSIFALNLCKYLDPTFNAETLPLKTAQTFEDFCRIAPDTEPYSVCWWDEAGKFSKRGAYDTNSNRVLLEYFQEAGGSKRIYVLCAPELQELDRKIIQRSRLFFETKRSNGRYYVNAWSVKQIAAIVRDMRLSAFKSRSQNWTGLPRDPTLRLQCNFKGIEEELKAYNVLKSINLKRTDEKLKSYAVTPFSDIKLQINRGIRELTGKELGRSAIHELATAAKKNALICGIGTEADIFKGTRDITIKSKVLCDYMVQEGIDIHIGKSIKLSAR